MNTTTSHRRNRRRRHQQCHLVQQEDLCFLRQSNYFSFTTAYTQILLGVSILFHFFNLVTYSGIYTCLTEKIKRKNWHFVLLKFVSFSFLDWGEFYNLKVLGLKLMFFVVKFLFLVFWLGWILKSEVLLVILMCFFVLKKNLLVKLKMKKLTPAFLWSLCFHFHGLSEF